MVEMYCMGEESISNKINIYDKNKNQKAERDMIALIHPRTENVHSLKAKQILMNFDW